MNDLVVRFLEDRRSLSEVELAALTRHLEDHPAELADMREQLACDELLSRRFDEKRALFVAQVKQATAGAAARTSSPREGFVEALKCRLGLAPDRSRAWQLRALAAAVVVLATTLVLWPRQPIERPIVTVMEAVGEVSWNSGGRIRSGLIAKQCLSAGTVAVENETGSVELRFADGTRMTLGGRSEAMLAAVPQKRIHLKSGSLTASVTRQPEGHPMLVRTPTAEVEVKGTTFAVNTQPEETRLNVEEGNVKFRRLADGNTMNVGARHSATASLNVQGPMQISTTAMPATGWSMPLTTHPGGGSKGEWRDADSTSPARMCSIPLVMGRKAGGSPVVHHGISIRESARASAGSFVTLTHGTTLALRWRIKQPAGLFIFLITQRPGGAFGGNFEFKLPASAGNQTSDGWRSISIPVSSFHPAQLNRDDFNGNGISALIVTTFEKDAGLEISLMDISAPGQTNDKK